jgi:hypothetical protein
MFKRGTWILVLAALLLAAGVYLLDEVQTRRETKLADQEKFLALSTDAVQKIQIERSMPSPSPELDPEKTLAEEARLVVVEQIKPAPEPTSETEGSSPRPEDEDPVGTWKITEPLVASVDPFSLNNLLSTASELKPAATIEGSTDLKEFGLDPAETTLTFTLKDGSSKVLKLGSEDFDGSGVYAQTPDGKIVTIPRFQKTNLVPTLLTLRDKTLFKVSSNQIQEIALQATDPGQSFSLTQGDQGWILKENPDLPLDKTAINRFLNPLLNLQATQFIAETQANLEPYGLLDPKARLTLFLKEQSEPMTVVLGKETPTDVYVITSQSPAVATVSISTATALQPPLTELRSKQLGDFQEADVTELVIDAQDPSLSRTLLPAASSPDPSGAPSLKKWEISDQPGRSVSLADLFETLISTKATSFIKEDSEEAKTLLPLFEKPLFRITLKLDSTSLDLQFAGDTTKAYARTTYQPDILGIDPIDLQDLRSAITALKPE